MIHPYLSNAISLLYTPESFSFQTSQELLIQVTNHKLPGKSCFNVSFVPSCPDHHDDHDNHDQDDDHSDHDEQDDHGDNEEVEGYVRRLEVIHKEVRGCLISYTIKVVLEFETKKIALRVAKSKF